MKLKAVLTFDYRSAKEAKAVAEALEPDNEGFVRTTLKGKTMSIVVQAGTAEALRHTLDDFLACLGVAEGAVGIKGTDAKMGKAGEEEDS